MVEMFDPGPHGSHPQFEADFAAVCDRYQVQAAVFYGGYGDRVLMCAQSRSRHQLALILERAAAMVPDVVQDMMTLVAGGHPSGLTRLYYKSRSDPADDADATP